MPYKGCHHNEVVMAYKSCHHMEVLAQIMFLLSINKIRSCCHLSFCHLESILAGNVFNDCTDCVAVICMECEARHLRS